MKAGPKSSPCGSSPAAKGSLPSRPVPGQLLVYRSSDAGESWSLASLLETGSLDRPAGFWASSPSAWELPAPAGLYVTTDAGGHWGLQGSGLSLDMTEVSFASPASGVGFASYPEVGLASTGDGGMRTSDGGRSWEPVQFSAPAFLGNFTVEVPFGTVDFASALDGWVGGADGVAATTDGGSAWTDQLATPEPVEELSFADAEHGWALTSDELFATSDGGAHWSVVPEPVLGAFSYVELVTPAFGVGVICDQTGGTRVVATHDEGRSWGLLPVPEPNELQCGTVPPSPGIISGVCFGTAQVGWAVLHGPGRRACSGREKQRRRPALVSGRDSQLPAQRVHVPGRLRRLAGFHLRRARRRGRGGRHDRRRADLGHQRAPRAG